MQLRTSFDQARGAWAVHDLAYCTFISSPLSEQSLTHLEPVIDRQHCRSFVSRGHTTFIATATKCCSARSQAPCAQRVVWQRSTAAVPPPPPPPHSPHGMQDDNILPLPPPLNDYPSVVSVTSPHHTVPCSLCSCIVDQLLAEVYFKGARAHPPTQMGPAGAQLLSRVPQANATWTYVKSFIRFGFRATRRSVLPLKTSGVFISNYIEFGTVPVIPETRQEHRPSSTLLHGFFGDRSRSKSGHRGRGTNV